MKLLRARPAATCARTISLIAVMVGSAGAAVTGTPAPVEEPPLAATTPRAPPNPSHTGLKRCLGSDGGVIFTDRRCEDLHAADLAQTPSQASSLVRTRTCARNQDDLLFGVRMAIESRDPNRLANFYHWTGLGTAEGYRVMDRLGVFLERPLLDVQLVSSRAQAEADQFGISPFEPPAIDAPDPGQPMLDETFERNMRDALSDDPYAQAPAPRRRPVSDLLRVDQMRSNEDLATQVTFFRLRNNAGCWWMQF